MRTLSRIRADRRAYRDRLKERLERVPEDVAWSYRGPVVLHAYMVAQEQQRREKQRRQLQADALLAAVLGFSVVGHHDA